MQGRVRAYAEKYHMIEPGGRTVAGVSGGPDSVCLLFLLKDLCGEKKNELSAVHVHHGLRGKEADGDETFCARTVQTAENSAYRIFVRCEKTGGGGKADAGGSRKTLPL